VLTISRICIAGIIRITWQTKFANSWDQTCTFSALNFPFQMLISKQTMAPSFSLLSLSSATSAWSADAYQASDR
jgi:hypothetical protein